MLFPTIDFAIFFGIVYIGNWLLKPYERSWKAFAIVASYVFYGWWDWRFVFLLAVSTCLTYAGGYVLSVTTHRRAVLAATVAAELGVLGWFKYAGFLSVAVDNVVRRLGGATALVAPIEVTLPVGISFFTFMGLSYVIDCYRRELEPAPALDVAAFVCFFPHLVAGPIVRGRELLPQIARATARRASDIDRTNAAFLIFGGLFKKVVVSSYVSSAIVDPVFNNPTLHSAPEILFAAYGYAVQIYCDFSGYTDIAIGCAGLLGFRFPENFDRPYSARSLQEFWRRWHMTLSRWLRDYLYIPLGGNRGSPARTYRNLLLTMVLGGLWHGAAWTFVLWGGLHGVGQVVGHAKRSWRVARGLSPAPESRTAQIAQRVLTFHLVCLGWIFFRAGSAGIAFTMCARLFTAWSGPSPLVRLPVVAAIAGSLALQFVPQGLGVAVRQRFDAAHAAVQGAALAGALLVITTFGPAGVAPFIYYRF